MRETRRSVLKAGAGLATTGALASLAGCSQVPVVGDVLGGGAFYQDQLYAPGTVSDRNHHRFSALRPTEMLDNEREFDSDTFDEFESFIEDRLFDQHGLRITEIDTLTSINAGPITMVTGGYDTENVVRNLEDEDFDFERETESGDHELFMNPGQQTCTAVGDASIVTMHSARALSAGDPVEVGGSTPTPGGVSRAVDRDVQDLRSIQYGESVRSQLDPNDPEGNRGWYEPVTFQGQEGDLVDISMESDPGDTYLYLEDPTGDTVASNDDWDGLNSRIQHQLESSGQYRIVATSYSDDATFPYVLTLRGQAVNQDLRSISYGDTETGAVDDGDPTNDLGFHEPVTFDGSEGDVVTITMSGPANTYLRLQDPSGAAVTEDASRIDRHTLRSSGEYTIVATSQRPDRTFVYDLSLELVFSPDQMLTAVESVLGVQTGETERYVSALEAANELVSAIGGGTIVSGVTSERVEEDRPETGRIENAVARGYSVQVGGQDSDYTAAAVFESQRDVMTRDVRQWVDDHSTLGEAREFDEAEQGRVGIVTGTIPTRDL